MKKSYAALLLVLCLSLSLLAGCGAKPAVTPTPAPTAQETAHPETREFTDSAGRTVTIPWEVTKIAVSGPLTQVYVFPLAPEMLVGFASEFSDEAAQYIPAEYLSLPQLGQLYGGKGTMDLEALLAADPDVVIDVGEAKGSIVEDLDALTEQTKIPFVHIDATVATAPAAYRLLGELTGKTEKAEELAGWCEKTYAKMTAVMEKVDADGKRKTVLYCLGDKGINVIAEASFHGETVVMMADNLAKLSDVVSNGLGNEVDMEQLLLWNPEYIIFAPDSIYDSVGADANWQKLDAVSNGKYVRTPSGPYGWLSSPPSVQRYLGMLWLGDLLYPEYIDYELQAEVTNYYKLFYGCDLTSEQYAALIQNAFPT
ncbi:MAG: ABC transporter substrate-binding protein [Oscillospiraceae bacterium]